MHTPLDPHLHTEECNKIIAELMRCHSENSKLKQLFGVCNQLVSTFISVVCEVDVTNFD